MYPRLVLAPAGAVALRICVVLGAIALPLSVAAQSTPFNGVPITVPATIEAENFDRGGEGVAYHDNRAGNAGARYRTSEDVDIITSCDSSGGGYVVNNFETGEWMKYTISVPASGDYDIELRASSKTSGSAFHFEIDDANVTGSIAFPNTKNWCRFQWAGKKAVPLAAGTHVLKVHANQQYFNLNQIRVVAAAGTPPPPPPGGGLPSTGTRAVPTYESVGLYWSSPGASSSGCEVKYRKQGESAWRDGLALWYDSASSECRGSLVHLAPATDYEVQLNLPGQPAARALAFRTWSETLPVARTVTVSGGTQTLNITEGGTASGYVLYQPAPGTVLDAGNAALYNVAVNASYVILRGFTLKGAQQDAIRISPNVTDVVIEDNDISGWGRQRAGSLGINLDSAVRAVCVNPTLERVTIQRNRIHDPRYGTNSWSDGHPEGPQGITFSHCGGNHVIRYNEITSPSGRYYNDIIGGEDNFTTRGFPYGDTDIHGNVLQHSWDDGIEAEGANRNVRIWGNYIDNTAISIATTLTSVGPVYVFRNVWNRSRFYERVSSPDADQRDFAVFSKSGSSSSFGNGRRYLFHNTMLQATQAGAVYGLGGGAGLGGTGSTQPVRNTVTRNNIFHLWKPVAAFYQIGSGNDFGYDLYNGSLGATDVGAIQGVPAYAPGNGWTSEAGGMYQLASNSPGYDRGARIPNFNDAFTGAAPDMGAHESGTPAMKLGLGAPPPPVASTPYGGTPVALPGTFEAENFDRGGEGVAYHDNVRGNAGGQYRTSEDVDIIVSADSAGGGYVVNNFETGEWLAYTVSVPSSGNYDITLRVSSSFTNSAFHVEVDGRDVTGRIAVPGTGGWSSFEWIGKTGVPLTAGTHVLRVVADQQYFNFNQVRVLASP